MEEFISLDGDISMDELWSYNSLESFVQMIIINSFDNNGCDHVKKHLEYLKGEA